MTHDPIRSASLVSVLAVRVVRGEGTAGDPVREVTCYFDQDGGFLADDDALWPGELADALTGAHVDRDGACSESHMGEAEAILAAWPRRRRTRVYT